MLVTTSIGQEGLDFHTYCRAVVHWNLPANPVDMEQREGRIHRYKGHAVRWNVALRHGASLRLDGHPDPWSELFPAAAESGPETSDATGLWPYWVCAADGGVTIERHVPALPLSREAEHLPALRNSLAVYRMVFGQPRQDDLVAYLLDRLTRSEIEQHLDRFRIDLSPPIVDLIAAGLKPCAEAEFAAEAGDQAEWAPADMDASASSGDSAAEAWTPDEETGSPSSEGDTGRNTPPPIWETERVDVMATIREVFASGGPRDREQAFRDVAVALGYQRTGSRIREFLNRDIQTALAAVGLSQADDASRVY